MRTKICNRCGRELSLDNFSKCKKNKDGLQFYCKKCRKKYYEKNKEEISKRTKKYYETHKQEKKEYCKLHKKKRKKYSKKYYEKHKKRLNKYCREYYKKNKEKIINNKREYNQKNRDKRRENGQRRLAKKRQLLATLTNKEWQLILKIFANRCAYCGKRINDTIHQEHIIPLQPSFECNYNPGYVMGNIVPSCASCNYSKHNNYHLTWMKENGYDYHRFNQNMLILNYLKRKTNE